jgi:hypothetical protein
MRQGDGSDFLGPGDTRGSDIGIIYVDPLDTRQDILKAISTQEIHGRKQIAIVLPEQRKAFRQPVDFDGLKNMRRGLQAQLVFIAPPGPGPAEFARQRRFPVYSSLDSFKNTILTQGTEQAGSRRVKSNPGMVKKPGLLAFGSRKGRGDLPPGPRSAPATTSAPSAPQSQRSAPQFSVADVDTVEFNSSNRPKRNMGPAVAATAGAAGLAAAGFMASGQSGEDDELYPPAGGQQGRMVPPTPLIPQTPAQVPPTPLIPQTPEIAADASGAGQAAEPSAKPPVDQRSNPPGRIIVFPPSSQASGRLTASQGTRTNSRFSRPLSARTGSTGQLQPGSGQQNQQNQSGGSDNGNSGKIAAAVAGGALGVAAAGLLANSGANASAAGAGTQTATPNAPTGMSASGSPGTPPVAAGVGAGSGSSGASAGMSASGSPGTPPVAAGVGAGAVGAAGVMGATGGIRAVQSPPAALTPLPPPRPRPPRRSLRGRTILLLLLLLLLSGILIGAIALNNHGGLPPILASDSKATVTITPASKLEQNPYTLSGVIQGSLNVTKREVQASILTAASATQSATSQATGSIPAKRATGTLTFLNTTRSNITISSTTLTGQDGVEIAFNGSVVVPVGGSSEATVNAYAVNSGAAGNIPAFDIANTCCTNGISVKNESAFTGGQNAVPNTIIEQSDIDGAAQPLINSLTSSADNSLKAKVQSTQRVVSKTQSCNNKTTANEGVGDEAKTVRVTVSVTCQEEVYDFQGAQQIGKNLLTQKAQNDPSLAQYMLDGQIVTNVTRVTIVGASNQLAIEVQAQGLWVYQFTQQMQQNIKQQILKLSQQAAHTVLLNQVGIAGAQIKLSGGNTMPSKVNDITLVIQTLPGINGPGVGTPVVPISTPTPSPTSLPSSPTPTNGLGGS